MRSATLDRALGGLGLATALAFVPGWHDPSVAPKLAVLSIGLPALLLAARLPAMNLGHKLMAAWLGYSAMTLLWTTDFWGGVAGLWLLTLIAIAFWLGSNLQTAPTWTLYGFGYGVAVSGVLVVLEQFTQTEFQAAIPNSGLFVNKNFLAEAGAVLLVWALLQRKFLLAFALIPTLWFTNCRSAVLALVVAVAVMFWHKSRAAAIGLVAVLASVMVWDLPSLETSATARVAYWYAALRNLTPFGHGLGSFYVDFPLLGSNMDTYTTRPEFPHNELINWLYTLGLGAIFPLALALWCFHRADAATARPVLAACAVVSFFGFPLQLPFSAALFGLVAGCAIRHRCSVRPVVLPGRADLQPSVAAQ